MSAASDFESLRAAIRAAHRVPEAPLARALCVALESDEDLFDREQAVALIEAQRRHIAGGFGIEHFLQEYGLGTEEGVQLLCLAEAFLRVPDAPTASTLIDDKLGQGDWQAHVGRSDFTAVNLATRALVLTQKLLAAERSDNVVARLLARGGEPALRSAVTAALRMGAEQFVFGASIDAALERSARHAEFRYSFDMLGEAARTAVDAQRYFDAYRHAIGACANAARSKPFVQRPSVSVKLSALHPRFEEAQRGRVMSELHDRLGALASEAQAQGIGLLVDAEESERLELTLDLFAALCSTAELRDWPGLGLAVQAYQKRALPVIRWLDALSRGRAHPIIVRLVKGAYWDSEIKRAQQQGLADYPVFTRKANTDVSYLACAFELLAAPKLFPAFASHNPITVAAVLRRAEGLGRAPESYEFQRLHGMGEGLYDALLEQGTIACRVYAPVGEHRDLLAYLVRRLLENGASTSFIHRLADASVSTGELLDDPLLRVRRHEGRGHPSIVLPPDLYGSERRNAPGVDLNARAQIDALEAALAAAPIGQWRAGRPFHGAVRELHAPADRRKVLGSVIEASDADIAQALSSASAAAATWMQTDVVLRAQRLEASADAIETERDTLIALLVHEAGKTLPDAISEWREAIDYCRYYAQRARSDFAPRTLPGPTGERNRLQLAGRGVFVCISPWNFPLAIFVGQIAAALVAGNAVAAKPAPQTPLIAQAVVDLLYGAGIPPEVLHLLPGGAEVGRALVASPDIAGVAFTGSVAAAHAIARSLAAKEGPIVPFIAETGGQNAMIVDSSALPEQVVADVLLSGFNSAGQRCSALRVLWLQDDIADTVADMLCGAMNELVLGDPACIATDIGPLIDEAARVRLQAHIDSGVGRILHRTPVGAACAHGVFFPPTLIELNDAARLRGETFGPIVHLVRWKAGELDAVLERINASGFGLTLGVHSRIDATIEQVQRCARVGNIYVNRSMIGAVVGVQPFGGEGLSGTGPKAGGPHYLPRFASERTVSIDTTAAGGNASLMAGGDG